MSEDKERHLPGGIAAALMTQRSELMQIVEADVRSGRRILSHKDQAEIIGLVGDLIQQNVENQDCLRDMLLSLKGIRTIGQGLDKTAERLLTLAEKCGVGN